MKLNFSLTSPVKLVSTSTARTSGKTLNKSNASKTAVSKAVKGLVSTSSNNTFNEKRLIWMRYSGKGFPVTGGAFRGVFGRAMLKSGDFIALQLLDDGRAIITGYDYETNTKLQNKQKKKTENPIYEYRSFISEWEYCVLVRDSLEGKDPQIDKYDDLGAGWDPRIDPNHLDKKERERFLLTKHIPLHRDDLDLYPDDDFETEYGFKPLGRDELYSESSSNNSVERLFGKEDEKDVNYLWDHHIKEGLDFKRGDVYALWITDSAGKLKFFVRVGTKIKEISKRSYLELMIYSRPRNGEHPSVKNTSDYAFNFKPNIVNHAD